jgi:sugar phosphate isomerase/epimerase
MATSKPKKKETNFRFCLNTSTISGQNPGLLKYIDIASKAGYDGIELWVRDVKAYLEAGNSAESLRKYIADSGLKVESAIGFAPWMTGKAGMDEMKSDMLMMASIGCQRIAAPPFGVPSDKPLDLLEAGQKYCEVIALGRQTGVMPLLEFWGGSKVLFHLGQAMMIAAAANDPDVKILADVYHLFRGNSGYDSLKMLRGNVIEVFHMNDYVDSIPREKQKDGDRVYPGDGAAPMKQILTDLKNMGGTKVLSLELFNETYWKQDALLVARTGLEKMKKLVAEIGLV